MTYFLILYYFYCYFNLTNLNQLFHPFFTDSIFDFGLLGMRRIPELSINYYLWMRIYRPILLNQSYVNPLPPTVDLCLIYNWETMKIYKINFQQWFSVAAATHKWFFRWFLFLGPHLAWTVELYWYEILICLTLKWYLLSHILSILLFAISYLIKNKLQNISLFCWIIKIH